MGDNIIMFSYGSRGCKLVFNFSLVNKDKLNDLDVENLLNSRKKYLLKNMKNIF